jgi:hypothetical protein
MRTPVRDVRRDGLLQRRAQRLRDRLPRATRRTVPRATAGDRGVVVQAVGPDDRPLSTRYACVRADDDPRPTIDRLKARIGEAL